MYIYICIYTRLCQCVPTSIFMLLIHNLPVSTQPLLIPFGESALLLAADQVAHHADGLGMAPAVFCGQWWLVAVKNG